jgi:hypothetical protein
MLSRHVRDSGEHFLARDMTSEVISIWRTVG